MSVKTGGGLFLVPEAKPKNRRANCGLGRARALTAEQRKSISSAAGKASAAKRRSSPEFQAKLRAKIEALQAKLPPASQLAEPTKHVEGARA